MIWSCENLNDLLIWELASRYVRFINQIVDFYDIRTIQTLCGITNWVVYISKLNIVSGHVEQYIPLYNVLLFISNQYFKKSYFQTRFSLAAWVRMIWLDNIILCSFRTPYSTAWLSPTPTTAPNSRSNFREMSTKEWNRLAAINTVSTVLLANRFICY